MRCPPTPPHPPAALQEGMATLKENIVMKRIPAFTLALLLAATGSAFAASSSHHESAPANDGSTTMHRLGADIRSGMHKIGAATRHAWHRATASMHRDHGNTSESKDSKV
jgi:hypothetical protein